jgi:hypothetical protein
VAGSAKETKVKVADLYAELGIKLDQGKIAAAEEALKEIARDLRSAEIAAEKFKIQTAKGLIKPEVVEVFNASAEAAKRFAKELQNTEVTKELEKLRLASVPKTVAEHPLLASLNKIRDRAKQAGASIKTWIGGALQHAAGNLISQGVNSFSESIKSTMDLGGRLDTLQKKTGVSARFLQEFAYSAGGVSEKLDEISGATVKFGLGLEGAIKDKKGPFVDAMKSLGISMDDPMIKMRDVEGLTLRVAEGFAVMGNGTKKQAVAAALYGKSGSEVIKPLSELIEKTKEFNEIGGGISDEQIAGLATTGDKVQKLGTSWSMLKGRAAAALAPMLGELADKITNWIAKNKKTIENGIVKVTGFLIKAAEFVGEAFTAISDWVSENKETIVSFFKIVGGVLGFIGKVVGLVATGLKIIGTLIGFVAAKIVRGFQSAWRGIKGFFTSIGSAIETAFNKTLKFADDILKKIKGVAKDIYYALNPFASKSLNEGEGEEVEKMNERFKFLKDNPAAEKAQGYKNFVDHHAKDPTYLGPEYAGQGLADRKAQYGDNVNDKGQFSFTIQNQIYANDMTADQVKAMLADHSVKQARDIQAALPGAGGR